MTISLLFGVHAHQPEGNFPAVLDEAHERCYRPFLQTLHGYPEFRFAAHFSGGLLDYLLDKYPADMALLKAMAARGQAEMFGSGDCVEPEDIVTRMRSGGSGVVCGRGEVIETLVPTRRLSSVDLPTFGRPTRVTMPQR